MNEKHTDQTLSQICTDSQDLIEESDAGLERILWKGRLLAIVLRSSFHSEDIAFFTPNSFSLQLAYMNHPQEYVIPAHDHNPVPRTVEWTQETLFIRSGKVRLDLYEPESRHYLCSRELNAGDVVLLAHGGHGFEMLEKSEMIEVKQGPYAGVNDKTRFRPQDGPLAAKK